MNAAQVTTYKMAAALEGFAQKVDPAFQLDESERLPPSLVFLREILMYFVDRALAKHTMHDHTKCTKQHELRLFVQSAGEDPGAVNETGTCHKPPKISFASKVMGRAEFGFAAGCAAVAMPRGRRTSKILGYALGAAFRLINPSGRSPNRGRSPQLTSRNRGPREAQVTQLLNYGATLQIVEREQR